MAKVGNTEGLCCQHNCKLQITLGAMPKLCKTFYYKHLPEFPRSTFDLEKFVCIWTLKMALKEKVSCFAFIKSFYLDILVWYFNIWSSTSFMDILPRKMEATVK